jgi:hypothetical protein
MIADFASHVADGSFASIWHVRSMSGYGGNLGNAGCSVLPLEGIGLDVVQAPKRESRIMRYELTDFEWLPSGRFRRTSRGAFPVLTSGAS